MEKTEIINILRNEKNGLILKSLYKKFEITEKEDKKNLRLILKSMTAEGILFKDENNRYKMNQGNIKGVIKFTRSGHMGFVKYGENKEIVVKSEDSAGAMHNDEVIIEKNGFWKDWESGKVVRIIKRNTKTVAGVYEQNKNFGFVTPFESKINYDIFIPSGKSLKAKNGQIVIAEIKNYGSNGKNPDGNIIKILGEKDDPKIDLPLILSKYNLSEPGCFPREVNDEIKRLRKSVAKSDLKGREDFSDELIYTIDGDDSKDFDDAVNVKKLKNGNYFLGVHIADVSNYVKEKTKLDDEAYRRSTSVYLINSVVPMLPNKLSDWLCSLVEDEIRLTVSLMMEIDKKGDVVNYNLYNSYIKSKKRLTYSKVNDLLSENPSEETEKEIGWLKENLLIGKELMNILRENRLQRGAILDIESDEVYFKFDSNGHVKDILPRKRGISEKMIEEFMIKANETVASVFSKKEIPFIYRIHENPDFEILQNLKEYLRVINVNIDINQNLDSKNMQKILEEISDHPLKDTIQDLLVRAMKRAVYSSVNVGHFGLASQNYTHFTSPIRRYPDLIVHRQIKKLLEGKKDNYEKITEYLSKAADYCSETERKANEAEWDFDDMKKIEYIKKFEGNIFEVIITSLTKFGFFVEIPDKKINGLIRLADLSEDYYEYDDKKHCIYGKRTGKIFKLGDKIQAKVVSADKIKLEVDFMPVKNKS